ncbi:thermonuclease family protein [Chitiniphilus purpureus]|uniref:Thermonuclease family protein n=1 Tax=Chitiniphilus purpureus TaxID=2981137 RepID=A0ABY6DMB5_9NEIS|nr:thermonuclease family protein [Chitiniphilus sp. CD1]UXY14828.1 thermonuclease family protein [Chitiniphilus sp. CD1]
MRGAALAVLAIAALCGCLSDGPDRLGRGETLDGRVIRIADGDTLTLLDDGLREHAVRLAFIDAPEKAQAYGKAAKWQLSTRVYGRRVHAEVVEVDRYGRIVARIERDGEDVNLALVEAGYAWHYPRYAKRRQDKTDFARYATAQRLASDDQRGLWQATRPQPPWDYRKRQRERQ